jgi:two-component system, NtrC family, sensor kinase
MTIARKFTLALLACVVAAVTAYAIIAARDELARKEADIVEYETSTAHALRPAIRDVWLKDGEGRALELVQDAQRRLGDVDLRCVSLDPHAAAEKRPRVDPTGLGSIAQGEDTVVVDRGYEGVGRIFTYVPVRLNTPAPVAIEVSRSLAGHGRIRRSVIRNVVLTAVAVALLSAVVTTLLGLALIERPLADLVTQARRVGEGDLSYRVATRRRDEIAGVASEMNRMCDRLREARDSERAQSDAKMQALAQLRHADRLATVGRLAAGLAHELGTPLNVVQARAKQMAVGTLTAEQAQEKAGIIVEQVERMTKLIRQLLDFARKRDLQPSEVDVRTLITGAVSLLDPIARKRSVKLEVAGDDTLPCRVDPEQMTQVVLNLVMNAVHASPPGGQVVIAVGRSKAVPPAEDGRSEQPCVRIEVRDQGTGIALDALPRIFEPFFTTKDVGEGTGLGLSVVYGIVKDHGGWIDVDSVQGSGSVFTVWLPERGRA